MVYDTLNPRIVEFILQDKRRGLKVLDVGCGTGRLGSSLKEKGRYDIYGIEVDASSAALAAKTYDQVSTIDLEELIKGRSNFNRDEKYDYIVFGDILEHTTSADKLLVYFRDFLPDDGSMIISLPNVANWMVRLKLLFGNFNYSGGILDQGHMKFFTYRTARALIEKSGYRIIAVKNNNQTLFFRFLGSIWKSMFAFQFVFKCVKAKEERA